MPIVLTELHRLASISSRAARIAVVTLMAFAMCAGVADARGYRPPHSAIVMDAKTGKILFSEDANAPRYPASLTKMMTLYILFDAMKNGKISKSTQIPVSAYAAGKPPTKVGFKPGETIAVDDAIYAVVTQSANDVATAIGEFLGAGSEARFAQLMTAKAHELGMTSTHFENASGLPDPQQRTTAHDMALLGIALQEHFPDYYRYFSTESFTYRGRRMRNHNHLLGHITGVDGIKTGFTNASGFNLVASAVQGDRRVVAVVMGGASARSRDAQVASLIQKYLPRATTRDQGPVLAARTPSGVVVPGKAVLPAPSVAPVPSAPAVLAYADSTPVPQPSPAAKAAVALDPVTTSSSKPDGWMIQIGSAPSADSARSLLKRATASAGRVLASAEPYTERFEKGSTVYHRARFAGFSSKDAATHACSVLKKKDFGCFAVSP